MVLEKVRNEYVRFGEHIDIEDSYKILRLEVQKEKLRMAWQRRSFAFHREEGFGQN